uniref:Uncharacterized protein n=1 Tax=Brassica oleracea var. oleracea TaxID=109376 RepID=A0A0D2ZX03_BRAOL
MEGKTFTFQVRVSAYNFTANYQTFTITHILNVHRSLISLIMEGTRRMGMTCRVTIQFVLRLKLGVAPRMVKNQRGLQLKQLSRWSRRHVCLNALASDLLCFNNY